MTSKKRRAEFRKQNKEYREKIKGEINSIDGMHYKDDSKEKLHVAILLFVGYCLFLLYFLPKRLNLTPLSQEYFKVNGMIAVMMFLILIFVFGYFPEMLSYWNSARVKVGRNESLTVEEKAHGLIFILWIICMIVFFGIVDFSFLNMKGGIPQIGSVALLSMWGFFRNVYRLRKANLQERKRKRDHEKHIEEIRSRRNPPPEK